MSKQNQTPVFLKIAFSFLVTPAVPAAILSCVFTLGWSPKTVSDGLAMFAWLFVLAYFVAGAHTLILGIPAFLLGKRLNAIRSWTCVPVGLVIGGSPMAIWGKAGWSAFISWGLFGAIGGLTFWLLWQFYVRADEPVETLDNVTNKETV